MFEMFFVELDDQFVSVCEELYKKIDDFPEFINNKIHITAYPKGGVHYDLSCGAIIGSKVNQINEISYKFETEFYNSWSEGGDWSNIQEEFDKLFNTIKNRSNQLFEENHPEQQKDEVFIGVFTPKTKAYANWNTARWGNIAYDSSGNVIEGMIPLFVKKEEIMGKK